MQHTGMSTQVAQGQVVICKYSTSLAYKHNNYPSKLMVKNPFPPGPPLPVWIWYCPTYLITILLLSPGWETFYCEEDINYVRFIVLDLIHLPVCCQCSVTCGAGLKKREISCRSKTLRGQVVLPDSMCLQKPQPRKVKRCRRAVCQSVPKLQWAVTSWSQVGGAVNYFNPFTPF